VLAAAEAVAAQRAPVVAIDPWLAHVFAYAVLEGKQAQSPVYGVDYVFDNRRYEYASSDNPPKLRSVLLSVPPTTPGEFVWAEETKVLAAQLFAGCGAEWARKLLQSPSKPTKDVRAVRDAAVERVLGKDWAKTEAKWQKQIAAIKVPFWIVSPLVVHHGKRLALVGTRETASTVFAEDPVPKGAYRIKATCALSGVDSGGGLRIQLDWDEESLIGVRLHQDLIDLALWVEGDPDWKVLTQGKAAIALHKPFDVAIDVGVEPNNLVLRIDGVEVLRWDCSKRAMRGSWSLANNEAVSFVEDLRIEPVAAGK
jgi:hypothetical protein